MPRAGRGYPSSLMKQQQKYPTYLHDFARGFTTAWTGRFGAPALSNGELFSNGTVSPGWCGISYNIPAITDDIEVGFSMGFQVGGNNSGGDAAYVGLGANSSGAGTYAFFGGGTNIAIATDTDWDIRGGTTTRVSGSTTWAENDAIIFRRVGNVYTLYKNGSVLLTWPDTTNIIARGPGNRLSSLGCHNSNTGFARFVKKFYQKSAAPIGMAA